jgi:phosphohistidine phosphatase
MPKTLYLIRHAEATPKEARQEDKSRELTQGGVKDSLHLGAWFAQHNTHWDLIVSSSALRAEQTANLLAEAMKLDHPRILPEDVLYDASVRQFLQYVNNIEDAYHSVAIVGHNPAISYLAEYLTKADIGDMPAGSAVIIRFDFSSWKPVSENTGGLERVVRSPY